MHTPSGPPGAAEAAGLARGVRTARPVARGPLVALAALSLGAGIVYYALVRGASPILALDPTAGTFPSFAHGFATAALLLAATAGRGPGRALALAVGANVLLTAALEATLGTFDPNDLVALGLGTLLAFGVAFAPRPAGGARTPRPARTPPVAVPLLLAASASMTVATSPVDDGRFVDVDAREPVYLSYRDLRSAIEVTGPRPLGDVGRVYLYEDTLFLNARNEGVHVIDNSDPSNPRAVAFIEIPGATELEIRDGVMYADSYVDLVAIDLGGSIGVGPAELVDAREEGIFPWDPYQNVPEGTRFRTEPDVELGVVIGLEGERR